MDVIALAQELIRRESVTPNDAGCQEFIGAKLAKLGFQITNLPFADVKNLWAIKGNAEPVLIFIGHTDVVPPGPLDAWQSDPFTPTIRDNKLYGRGAADMKSSIAAMMVAVENFLAKQPNHQGSIAFLITSDEEGDAINGTTKVVDYLVEQQQPLTWCLVGEASSEKILGDTIKIGRRGSLHGHLTVLGKQGHIAYPQLANNPIHRFGKAIDLLAAQQWDQGNEHFPPTSFQISNIVAGTGAKNVIPGQLECDFNFRYAPVSTVLELQEQVHKILKATNIEYQIQWNHSAQPFYTEDQHFIKAVTTAIEKVCQVKPTASTTGGTSDGRFIAQTGCAVTELGPINASIHQVDEHVDIDDLRKLSTVYEQILYNLLSTN